MRILVTRPEPDATVLANQLEALGHSAPKLPLMEVVFTPPEPLPLAQAQALIATSRNGLRALAAHPSFQEAQGLPIVCVGTATAGLARQMGFKTVLIGDQTAQSLPNLIARCFAPTKGPLIHLAGRHLARDTGAELARLNFEIHQPVMYESRALQAIPANMLAALKAKPPDAVMLLSPRTAKIFVKLIKKHDLGPMMTTMICFCLSPNVAKSLTGLETTIKVSPTPRLEALIAMINDNHKNHIN